MKSVKWEIGNSSYGVVDKIEQQVRQKYLLPNFSYAYTDDLDGKIVDTSDFVGLWDERT